MAAILPPSELAVMFYFHNSTHQFLFQYMRDKITLLMRACRWLFLG